MAQFRKMTTIFRSWMNLRPASTSRASYMYEPCQKSFQLLNCTRHVPQGAHKPPIMLILCVRYPAGHILSVCTRAFVLYLICFTNDCMKSNLLDSNPFCKNKTKKQNWSARCYYRHSFTSSVSFNLYNPIKWVLLF